MHQQLIDTYTNIMADLGNLPAEIAAAQTDLNAAKLQLATSERTLADIEAHTSLNVEGKNAEERKARLGIALKADLTEKALAILEGIDDAQVQNGDGYFDVAVEFLNRKDPANTVTFFTKALAKDPTIAGIEEYRKMLGDENPAELYEARGAALWKKARGPKNVSRISCSTGRRSPASRAFSTVTSTHAFAGSGDGPSEPAQSAPSTARVIAAAPMRSQRSIRYRRSSCSRLESRSRRSSLVPSSWRIA